MVRLCPVIQRTREALLLLRSQIWLEAAQLGWMGKETLGGMKEGNGLAFRTTGTRSSFYEATSVRDGSSSV